MGSNQDGPTRADLTQGIPQEQVADGGSLAGQVGGEAGAAGAEGGRVARDRRRPAATTAARSPEGLIVGRYGAVPLAPRLLQPAQRAKRSVRPRSTVACYQVEARAGRSGSPARKAQARAGSRGRGDRPDSVVIVGGGAAGDSAAATLRREGYDGPITIVDPDTDAPYDRPNSPRTISPGTRRRTGSRCARRTSTGSSGIERLRGRRVGGARPADRRVQLDDGSNREYGALLLATGATPYGSARTWTRAACRCTISGHSADSRAIIAAAAKARPSGGPRGELHRPRGRRLAPRPQAGSARGGAGGSPAGAGHGPRRSATSSAAARGARRRLPSERKPAEIGRAASPSRTASGSRPTSWWPASASGPIWSWRRPRGCAWTAA